LALRTQLELKFKEGKSFSYTAVGKFQNTESSQAITQCDDMPFNAAAPAGAASIFESGTYCSDGRRVGDTGMLDADYMQACGF
jgi:hypothetical protein